jgi:transcriptional regulator with XRE-family HTH domain
MTFGERLRQLRRERQMNQRALAERAGIDFTYLSKLENGRMAPRRRRRS